MSEALAIFDGLCERRVSELVDRELVGQLIDALAVSGRAAELVTRFLAPSRTRLLVRFAGDATSGAAPGAASHDGKLGDAIPAGVLELVIALLPSIPAPPRALVEQALGSAEVRAEVRRLLEETVGELMARVTGGTLERRGVLGWGARAASMAGRGIFGALGGELESKLGDAVEFGVGLAQARLVDAVASPENARRVGKELAHLAPRIAEVRDAEVARALQRAPHALLDGLLASLLAHNAARPLVRAILVDEAQHLIDQLSEETLGELLDRYGARAPLRAATARFGGPVVAAIAAHVRKDPA